MGFRVMAFASAVTALLLAGVVVYLLQEQRDQARELTRLRACVSTLERNQATPPADPIMGCPIYN
jgi:hypothetical protein